MTSPEHRNPQNGNPGGGPKRSLLSIIATVVVLGLLLFTGPGREMLGNLLDQGGTASTDNSPQTDTQGSAASGDQTSEDAVSADGRVSATVERTVDGDTFIAILEDGSRERVRMLLLDTPETKKEGTPVQPFGPEASEYAKKLLGGKQVELEFDEEQRDQYDRMLAYVYLDGHMVNEQLLEQGLARVVVYQPNDKYIDEFRKIQDQAKQKKLGVWSIEGYADNRGFHPEAAE
ncbi:thermonuclease family protein [Saccharibacillus sacchari]|uniref:thermonuclease family protein n=1 Tax=Saccharibacillus sacchari TaxID=456493 RepID=UPI0004B8D82D|nr:thermonuclease family protein [Saccharibacillus sacchari]